LTPKLVSVEMTGFIVHEQPPTGRIQRKLETRNSELGKLLSAPDHGPGGGG